MTARLVLHSEIPHGHLIKKVCNNYVQELRLTTCCGLNIERLGNQSLECTKVSHGLALRCDASLAA